MKISKNDVFYTKINGEVYAMRFKHLLVDFGVLNERELEFERDIDNDFPSTLKNATITLFKKFSSMGIKLIVAEFAPIGEEKIWKRYGMKTEDKTFNPYRIYSTIEDCVDEVNPLFVKGWDSLLYMKEEYRISLDEITPTNFVWEKAGRDFCGRMTYILYTYIWDGSRSVRKCVERTQNYLDYMNLNNNLIYDIIEEKLIFDDDIKEIGYCSEEECRRNNAVKVHLFIN